MFYCNFIKEEALAQVFSCEFCEISKNIFFTEHLRATASVRFKKNTLHSVDVSSSPNSLLLFVIVFWDETNKSSLSQIKFLLAALLKWDSNTGVFLEICEIFKDTFFYRTTPVAASEQTQEISVVHFVAKWCFGHLAQVCLSYPISCENC